MVRIRTMFREEKRSSAVGIPCLIHAEASRLGSGAKQQQRGQESDLGAAADSEKKEIEVTGRRSNRRCASGPTGGDKTTSRFPSI
uniref:Uncharacterized protein n=1 Tax=Oryza glaberrima TaxID=4538 RepID=I1Q235_ORYGL